MKKKILASLLALVLVAAPVTVLANPVTVPAPVIDEAISQIAQRHVVTHGGQTYLPLRATLEAFAGVNVAWEQATRTVVITLNGSAALAANAPINLAGLVQPGTYRLELQEAGNRLVIANGPAAGTQLVAYRIGDAFMFPVTVPANLAALSGQLHQGLLNAAGVGVVVGANDVTVSVR